MSFEFNIQNNSLVKIILDAFNNILVLNITERNFAWELCAEMSFSDLE